MSVGSVSLLSISALLLERVALEWIFLALGNSRERKRESLCEDGGDGGDVTVCFFCVYLLSLQAGWQVYPMFRRNV